MQELNRRLPGIPSETSEEEKEPTHQSILPVVPEKLPQKRDREGKFKPRPLAGRGGAEDWPLYRQAAGYEFGGANRKGNKAALLMELGPLTEIQCFICNGYGHTAGKKGKRCPTAQRLDAMKGSKVMGAMLADVLQELKVEVGGYDVQTRVYGHYMKRHNMPDEE